MREVERQELISQFSRWLENWVLAQVVKNGNVLAHSLADKMITHYKVYDEKESEPVSEGNNKGKEAP